MILTLKQNERIFRHLKVLEQEYTYRFFPKGNLEKQEVKELLDFNEVVKECFGKDKGIVNLEELVKLST